VNEVAYAKNKKLESISYQMIAFLVFLGCLIDAIVNISI
jgi:hypothetical protein